MDMQNLDIATLVKAALQHLGFPGGPVKDIDGHSTICFNFDDAPSIYLVKDEYSVWLWSRISEFNESAMAQYGNDLLTHLMEPQAYLQMGQPILAERDGYLEYRGALHQDFLQSPESFGFSLQSFFNSMSDAHEIVNR
ncbi:hypothetical protein [Janthinobacterium sp. B9-8]|uniref:InvB/SpaK family type III secretion system chaperone n=1 Tax=Janthinobacterium sp. B9-8 TaxID=1236179 RepID=UPI00061CE160|nr:hypothetical protein [Janthinobacterium sp. B9-8]AMC33575.1 hypothetical protein VN23_02660 [Janthinobacterium sp. B9-8]